MAVIVIAVLVGIAIVASFIAGALLGIYAGSKGAYPHKNNKEANKEEQLTLEKQFENMMNYGGGE